MIAAKLLRLELRHNAMAWMLPVAIGLFYVTSYRKLAAMPPLWNVRADGLQSGAILAFITPAVGAAAWMGAREARRRVSELTASTARPRWARLLTVWAATCCWALAGYLVCVAAAYGMTARQAHWGGPLWWPVAVAGVSLPALTAIGFAAGTLLPSRFTPPLAAVGAFFALALSTELIVGSQSYWQIAPLVTGPWDDGHDAGVATFYRYLPDLPIAQLMFLGGLTVAVLATLALGRNSGGPRLRAGAAVLTAAGLLAAGTAVDLAGTGRMNAHGMIAIPALHDAANDQPIRFTPVCSRTAIPVCLNPAYASYLPAVMTVFRPVLSQIAGLPGAPVLVSQAAARYQQGAGNSIRISLDLPGPGGHQAVRYLLLPDQLAGPAMTPGELASDLRWSAAPALLVTLIGDNAGSSPAQQAVTTAMMVIAGLPVPGRPPATVIEVIGPLPEVAPGSPAYAAARRFAACPAPVRRAWLAAHLTALRAGRVTLAQLP
jgi:hypothetical protein